MYNVAVCLLQSMTMGKFATKYGGCRLRKDAFTYRARSVSATSGNLASASHWTPSYIIITFSLGISSAISLLDSLIV